MLPTFFLAGVPKAGTSSLHDYLDQHPEVFMSETKEPHHFSWEDDGWPNWAVKDRAAYEALFDEARPGQERGEASTWTLYSEGAPRRIAQAIPEAKFIVLLRSPTSRAYSNWTFNRASGFEPLETFEAALDAEPQRIAEGSPWHRHYVRAGLYHEQVRRYIDVFGRDRILVLLFEDFKADGLGAVRRAFEFLGVDPTHPIDVARIHNKTTVPRHRWLHAITSGKGIVKKTVKALLPEEVHAQIGRQIRAANSMAPPPLSPEMRARLDGLYRDDVARLSDLLDMDLAARWLG